MLWCFDAGMFHEGLKIAVFALEHGLDMPDSFSRDTPSIVAEEIANAALTKLKASEVFDLNTLLDAEKLTEGFDLHDPIRAKLYCAIGKVFLSEDNYVPAIEYMKKAIAKKCPPHLVGMMGMTKLLSCCSEPSSTDHLGYDYDWF